MQLKKHVPIRMCVACRKRFPQHSLLRLKETKQRTIAPYDGVGRSLYLCETCAQTPKKRRVLTKRYRCDDECLSKLLKEFF